MANFTVSAGIQSAFLELLHAANRDRSEVVLKTADLSDDIKREQFPRFASLARCNPHKLQLHGSGYIIRFECMGDCYLAINTNGFTAAEKQTITDFLAIKGLYQHIIEESFFLYLRFHLGRLYRLKPEQRDAAAAIDVLDIASEDGYAGHEISDLITYHEDLQCYVMNRDSEYTTDNIWSIASSLAANIPVLRSALIDERVSGDIERIALVRPKLAENAYTALTSIHWKYIYFELYKCLEGLFFLPWGIKAKQALKLGTALEAHRVIRSVTSFREQEKTSIESLFELISDPLVAKILACDIANLKGLGDGPVKPQVGRRIYKIRNCLVHQEDYEDREPLDLDGENWPALISAMCEIIVELYLTFEAEIEET